MSSFSTGDKDLSKAVLAPTTVKSSSKNQFARMMIARVQQTISVQLDRHRNVIASMPARLETTYHNVQMRPAKETQTINVPLETTKIVNARAVQKKRLKCQYVIITIVLGRRTKEAGLANRCLPRAKLLDKHPVSKTFLVWQAAFLKTLLATPPKSGGTTIHINAGCISINGSPRCAPQTYNNLDVSDQGKAQSTATIYAQFNGQDTTDKNVIPGCELKASWPRDYRDIYFGLENSNCLYESGNKRIDGQCCTAKTTTSVANPYFKESPPNKAGTNIHINAGCININGSPRCAPQIYNVADQGKAQSTATIYAQFNGQDTTDVNVVPGCELIASWPRDYHDIYFGQDNSNCLYDSGNNRINDQCCTSKTTTSVANPYFKQAPSSTSNPSNPQCTSFAGWSCLKNCIGWTPCPGWCDVNCGGIIS
ncbi:hypothetical protein V8E54_000885 [Elaphomyces granulatus]